MSEQLASAAKSRDSAHGELQTLVALMAGMWKQGELLVWNKALAAVRVPVKNDLAAPSPA